MTNDVSLFGLPSRGRQPRGLERQVRQQTDAVSAEAEVVFATDALHAFLTAGAIKNIESVYVEGCGVVERNPGAAAMVEPVLRAYAAASADRLGRFGRSWF